MFVKETSKLNSQKDSAIFKNPNHKDIGNKQFQCLRATEPSQLDVRNNIFFFQSNGTKARTFLKRKWKRKANER